MTKFLTLAEISEACVSLFPDTSKLMQKLVNDLDSIALITFTDLRKCFQANNDPRLALAVSVENSFNFHRKQNPFVFPIGALKQDWSKHASL